MSAVAPDADVELIGTPRGATSETLAEELLAMFRRALSILDAGRPIVAIVEEQDILGHGAPFDAAAAHAVVGMVRALAIEGAGKGWRINALSVTPDTTHLDRARLASCLTSSAAASGTLLRLGSEQLGRVSV